MLILLVEDNADHAELVKRSLERNRLALTIVHVEDGAEAIDYLNHKGKYSDAQTYPLPSLILLDLRLPKLDGLTVLELIKNSDTLATIPVVILTSSQAEADVNAAYLRRANSYIVKPLDYEKFVQMMHDLGLYWVGWNTQPAL
jgi:CheY-like chemotaxis protein